MAKNYSNLEGLIGNVKESIRNAYDKGYKQGFNEGYKQGSSLREIGYQHWYKKGLDNAWECARKIMCDIHQGGYPLDTLRKIFGTASICDIFSNFSASEAIAKIKEYEEKAKQADNEIKVGDEVVDGEVFNSGKGIVTFVSPVILYVLWYDGSTGRRKLTDVKKTGRTFPQIIEVLEQMKGGTR